MGQVIFCRSKYSLACLACTKVLNESIDEENDFSLPPSFLLKYLTIFKCSCPRFR